MTIACLYCGLQLPDTAEFCPECGRPIERDFEIRPIQPSAWDRPGKEMKAKDDLQRQHGVLSRGSVIEGVRSNEEEEYVLRASQVSLT